MNRAREYGLNRDLKRRPIPRISRVAHTLSPNRAAGSSSCTSGCAAGRLSYAAMAARPPVGEPSRPTQQQARDDRRRPSFHRPAQGRGRDTRSNRDNLPRGQGRGAVSHNYRRGQGAEIVAPIDAYRHHAPHQRYVPVSKHAIQKGEEGGAQPKEQVQPAKSKKPQTLFCFRCKCTGHLNVNCIADLDCYICNKRNSHVTFKCPILKLQKPSVSMSGCAKNELCFYRIPEFDYKREVPDPAPTASIIVAGGHLSAVELQTELAKLSRVEWNWEALSHGENAYLVAFPSEEELLRMSDIEFKLKSGVIVKINQWVFGGDATPAYHLDELWVHVTGVPHARRHYLGFWALGSTIGATLDVDMLTYRRKGVICLLVGVMGFD